MSSLMVRSPLRVSISTLPVDQTPVGLTLPTVRAPALVRDKLPRRAVSLPPAKVVTLLPALLRANVPPPCKPKPVVVMAADCVTAPVACRLMLPLLVDRAPSMATAAPYTLMGPATVKARPMVTLAVLVAFPMRTSVAAGAIARCAVFTSSRNAVPTDSSTSLPLVLIWLWKLPLAIKLARSASSVMFEVLAVETPDNKVLPSEPMKMSEAELVGRKYKPL